MNRPKIVITRRWPEEVERRLSDLFDTTLNKDDRPMSAEELRAAFTEADAVLPTVSDRIDAEVLAAEPMKARLIGSFGVGFNHIDIAVAKERGLTVTNTPEVLTDCTADLAMTLLLMTARRAGEGERHVRHGEWTGWRPTHMMGTKVTGKTIGIIGMGRIGVAMARRAHHGFGMRVIYYDQMPVNKEFTSELNATGFASVEEVLANADFVSLHCPGGEATYHLMNAERLALMQSHAILINSARGDVIDEPALLNALKSGVIAGAGLDVYEKEPRVTEGLRELENVVLLPHLGSATRETRVAMGLRVLRNVEAFFAGQTPPDVVE
ncbi:MAG: 2-hydroxyacid dehydrogenase [Alphaproteobacteria bacterium]